jgi:hypothetical protein
MSSFRQIEANRRNARLSTGPVTEEGKKISRRNAVRHGLTAETVITALEDTEDYAAFEMAVTADYDPQTAVERELVLRLASLLWRLRRANAIEAGLFEVQARQSLQFRQQRPPEQARQSIVESLRESAIVAEDEPRQCSGNGNGSEAWSQLAPAPVDQSDDLTRAFSRLADLPNYPLERLSRYEARLWRQACQILFALQCLSHQKPWQRLKPPDGRHRLA